MTLIVEKWRYMHQEQSYTDGLAVNCGHLEKKDAGLKTFAL